MIRARLLGLGLGLALVAVLAAPASAQDAPVIELDQENVEETGMHDFVVTGSNFTMAPIFVLPCDAPESGDLADLDTDTCDTAQLTPATPADGAFEVTVTYDVPAGGIVIAASSADQAESAAVMVTVGSPAEEETAEEEEEPEEEDLANTGAETGLLVVLGLAIAGAGAMAVGYTRRFA